MEQQKEAGHHARSSSCSRKFSYNISVLPSHNRHILAISLPLHWFYRIQVWICTPRCTWVGFGTFARVVLSQQAM